MPKYNLVNERIKRQYFTYLKEAMRYSVATVDAVAKALYRFEGYKSRLRYSDAVYFNLSENDTRIATARRGKRFPTLEQVKRVIATMPSRSEIERRNRALVAFAFLTGARDSAIASMKLKHIDLVGNSVYQDARDVKTKFSKTFTSYFFPVGDDIRQIVED